MTAEERIERGAHANEIEGCSPAFARAIIEQVAPYQRRFRKTYGKTLVYLADEYYIAAGVDPPAASRYDGFAQYENGIGMTRWLLDDWRKLQRERARRAAQSPSAITEIGGQGLARSSNTPLGTSAFASGPIRRMTWVCGVLVEPVLRRVADEFASMTGIDISVRAVTNDFFGPRVNVSGLL